MVVNVKIAWIQSQVLLISTNDRDHKLHWTPYSDMLSGLEGALK